MFRDMSQMHGRPDIGSEPTTYRHNGRDLVVRLEREWLYHVSNPETGHAIWVEWIGADNWHTQIAAGPRNGPRAGGTFLDAKWDSVLALTI